MKRSVRYGLPLLVLIVGCVVLFLLSHEAALVGAIMIAAFAFKAIFLGEAFRIGFSGGNKDREDEVAAREFLSQHGHWPDEAPPVRPSRKRHQ